MLADQDFLVDHNHHPTDKLIIHTDINLMLHGVLVETVLEIVTVEQEDAKVCV
jgi:hypothetical protein